MILALFGIVLLLSCFIFCCIAVFNRTIDMTVLIVSSFLLSALLISFDSEYAILYMNEAVKFYGGILR